MNTPLDVPNSRSRPPPALRNAQLDFFADEADSSVFELFESAILIVARSLDEQRPAFSELESRGLLLGLRLGSEQRGRASVPAALCADRDRATGRVGVAPSRQRSGTDDASPRSARPRGNGGTGAQRRCCAHAAWSARRRHAAFLHAALSRSRRNCAPTTAGAGARSREAPGYDSRIRALHHRARDPKSTGSCIGQRGVPARTGAFASLGRGREDRRCRRRSHRLAPHP